MKTKRIVLLLAVLVVFAVAMTSCAFLSQYHEHVWEGGSCTEPRVCSVCHAVDEKALGHAEETVTGYAATCTETGLTDGAKCSICDAVIVAQEEIAKLAHTPGDAATCTTGQECTVCHNEIASALGHDIVVDEAIEADCLNSGLTEGQHCSRCDDATVEQETIPALGHDIVKDAAKAPTCTENGLTAGEHCTKCDYNSVQEVAALGHDMVVDAAKAPTCTEDGLKEGSHCSRCDHKVAQEVDPALGHNIVKDEAKAPTCTETGLTEGEHCTRCDGATVAQQSVAALGHKYENFVCTECQAGLPALSVTDSFDFTTADGLDAALASGKLGYTGTFRNNGDSHQFAADSSIQFVVPANTIVTITGHSTGYGVFDVYLNGVKTDMAGVLSFTVTEETKVVIVPDEEATYSKAYLKGISLEAYVDRTITEDTTINFGSEGNYKDSIVDFSGIQIGDNGDNNSQVKNGSFDLLLKAGSKVVIHGYPGYTSYKLNGGEEITAEWYTYLALTDMVLTVTPVNGNNYFYSIEITLHEGIELVAAKDSTCSVAGHEEYYTCSCHGELTEKVARELLAHNEETVVGKAATCTETGLTNGKKCSVCGAILEAQQLIPAAGHKDDNNDYKCDVCEADLCTEHVAGEAVEENRTEATCTAAGSYDSVVKCQHCHEELSRETVSIPILPHTEVKDAAVDPTCTKAGLTEGKHCSVCGTVTEAQVEIPENGHTEQTLAGKDATCTEAGLTEGKKCSVCGETLVAQNEIPALDHAYETIYVWAADNSYYTEKQVCKNDASHVVEGETVTVSHITLNVTASKVTFTYHAGEQTKVVESDLALENNIATIYAPAVEGRVASHDFVKYGFHDAAATYEFTIYYSEIDVWDGVSVSEGLAGEGTLENPYLIQSAADFAYFAGVLNAVQGDAGTNYKVTTFSGQYFKMTKSVDLNGHSLIVGMHAGWNNYQGFFGSFDGNNCTIRGININNNTTNSSALFGCIAKGGSVKNLSTYGTINGRVRLSGLVGYLLGTVDNITSYVTLNQTGTGNETGTVGGVVANQENSGGAITNCVNYGTITGQSYIFGGIVGSGGATIENCVNWGNVTAGNVSVGGISGSTKDKGTITGCVNYGTISTTSVEYGKVGGIVGSAVKPINNCVNYGDVIALHTAGGIAGDSTKEITGSVNYGKVIGVNCTSYSLNQITSSNVTKTDCVENGSIVIPEHKLIHTDAKAATCEADGNVAYDHCSVCDKNYDADGKVIANVVVNALGHDWDSGVIANGKITFTCNNDASHTRVEVAKVTITVNHLNLDGSVAAEAESLEFDYNTIATINAKTIEGYVASHDYVKVHVLENASVTIYYSQVSVWDGTGVWDGTSNVATSLDALGGSGTQADPYIIDEAQDLVMIANIVNSLAGGTSSTLIKDKYFKMTKSIDLNNNPLYIGGFSGWSNRQIFNGHLDGNNCSIRGINNDRALFGCIEGTVNNLSLYGKVYNDKQAGNEAALVGYLRGHVHYITNYADVSGHTQVGGVIGNLESKTASTHLTNYGTIRSITAKGTWSAVGGVIGCVGYSHSDLVNWGDVYSVGSSAGGIGGYGHSSRAGNVTNAYNYGTVYCTYQDKGQILGLIASHTYVNCHENGAVVDSLPTEE